MKKSLLLLFLVLALGLTACGVKTEYYVNEAFLSENIDDITYETSANCINWGEYQTETGSVDGTCVELYAGSFSADTKESFESVIKAFKTRLDILKTPYAVGYSGERADTAHIQIDAEKIGLPVLALLNVNYRTDKQVISEMGDLKVIIDNFQYELGADGEYNITVAVKESYDVENFKNYCAANQGSNLYLKLGEMTFSSGVINEGTTETNIQFTGMSFLGKNAVEHDYEMLMELAQFVVNEERTAQNGASSFRLSIEEGDAVYGIPYITEVDEAVIETISAKYPEVIFQRRSVENRIRLEFANTNEVLKTEDYFNKIEDIYTMCDFDSGAYSDVSFYWPSCEKKGYPDILTFTKKDGKMVTSYAGDRIAEKADKNSFLLNHKEK